MMQIPPALLPSTAEVRVPVDGEWGGALSDGARTITGVRFERTSSIESGDCVSSDSPQGTLYIDAANSAGAFEVPEGSEVVVDGGNPMTAVSVRACTAFGPGVHHWEVELR